MTIFITIIGYLAGILSVFAFIPQAIKTCKTKNTEEISLKTYLIYNIANILFLLLAILSIALPIMHPDNASKTEIILWGFTLILPYTVTIIGVSSILFIKIQNIYKFQENAKKIKNPLNNEKQIEENFVWQQEQNPIKIEQQIISQEIINQELNQEANNVI